MPRDWVFWPKVFGPGSRNGERVAWRCTASRGPRPQARVHKIGGSRRSGRLGEPPGQGAGPGAGQGAACVGGACRHLGLGGPASPAAHLLPAHFGPADRPGDLYGSILRTSGISLVQMPVSVEPRVLYGFGVKLEQSHEQPLVAPQVVHFKQVPLRTMVKLPQSPQESPT